MDTIGEAMTDTRRRPPEPRRGRRSSAPSRVEGDRRPDRAHPRGRARGARRRVRHSRRRSCSTLLASYRPMTAQEIADARTVFGDKLDYETSSSPPRASPTTSCSASRTSSPANPESRAFVTDNLVNFDVDEGDQAPHDDPRADPRLAVPSSHGSDLHVRGDPRPGPRRRVQLRLQRGRRLDVDPDRLRRHHRARRRRHASSARAGRTTSPPPTATSTRSTGSSRARS